MIQGRAEKIMQPHTIMSIFLKGRIFNMNVQEDSSSEEEVWRH